MHLAALPNLETMYLTGTKISDAAVDELAKHDKFQELYIRWTQISNVGAERLATVLPNCAIYHHALANPKTR